MLLFKSKALSNSYQDEFGLLDGKFFRISTSLDSSELSVGSKTLY
jgi:hypothetical protein